MILELKDELLHFLNTADRQEIHHPEKNILFSCLLFPILQKKIQEEYLDQEIYPHLGEIFTLTRDLIRDVLVVPFPRFPRWMRETIAFILNAQFRFTPLDPKRKMRKFKILGHKKFPLAMRFLALRACMDDDSAKEYARIKRISKNKQK